MFSIVYTNKMKRDVKRIKKRGKDISKLTVALDCWLPGYRYLKSTRITRSKVKCEVIANVTLSRTGYLSTRFFETN